VAGCARLAKGNAIGRQSFDLGASNCGHAIWLSDSAGSNQGGVALRRHRDTRLGAKAAELPAFDKQCDPQAATSSVGFLRSRERGVLHEPGLRSFEEIEEHNELIYNSHWRVRNHQFSRAPYDFEKMMADEPLEKYGVRLAEKDFAVDGVPLTRLPENVRRSLGGIMQERHRASNWLIGYDSEDFYEVATDT